MAITHAFGLIAAIADAMGVRKINELPGPWVLDIDGMWKIAINATMETQECRPEGTMGATLAPMETAVWFNGWLASIMYPQGGSFVAGDDCNEDSFIAALECRLEKEGGALPSANAKLSEPEEAK